MRFSDLKIDDYFQFGNRLVRPNAIRIKTSEDSYDLYLINSIKPIRCKVRSKKSPLVVIDHKI